VDGAHTNYSVDEDGAATRLSFSYKGSILAVEIIGTEAIPEFPSIVILPMLLTATLLIMLCRRRLPKNSRKAAADFNGDGTR
jgi:hypothetical protein